MSNEWSALVACISLVSAAHLSLALLTTHSSYTALGINRNIKLFSLFFAVISFYSILGFTLVEVDVIELYRAGLLVVLGIGCFLLFISGVKLITQVVEFTIFSFVISGMSYYFFGEINAYLPQILSLTASLTISSAIYCYLYTSKLEKWIALILIFITCSYLMSSFSISYFYQYIRELEYLHSALIIISLLQLLVLFKLTISKSKELRVCRLASDLAQVGILVLDKNNKVIYANKFFNQSFEPAKQRALISQLTNEATIINRKITHQDHWNSILKTGAGDEEEYTCVSSCILANEGREGTAKVLTFIDITEQTNYKKALEESGNKLNELSNRLLSSHEIERTRISRELHDDIGQQLTLLKFTSALIDKKDVRAQLELGVEDILTSVRELSRQLRPAVIDELGLPKAIEGFIKSVQLQGVEVNYQFENSGFELVHPVDINLYRIIYDYISIAVVKDKATSINLYVIGDKDKLTLTMEDNVTRVNPSASIKESSEVSPESLITIKERVRVLSGKISISSLPGVGSRIKIEIDSMS